MPIKSMNPGTKYPRKNYFRYPERTWIDKQITQAPIWASVDLRDGNQALPEPMSLNEKMEYFDMLADIGFREIEIGCPAASTTEFAFARKLIEEKRIPDDVKITVFTQARPDLVAKTIESIKGAPQAIFHIYVATSETFQNFVFQKGKQEIIDMAVDQVKTIKQFAKEHPETKIQLQFSMEHFSDSNMETARDVSNAVIKEWGPTPDNKMILNLPATVEVCPPHVYADMTEYMSNNIINRDNVILSVHTHNDRNTGTAASEMALQAGAQRVEGCLFGQGERTGNVPIEAMALNLFVDGIDPKLDFSKMPKIVEAYESLTKMPVPARQPYAGELVTTSFAGGHQDAIKKGFEAQKTNARWIVPYLTFDPQDIGRDYNAVVRVNEQSGRSGIAYIIEKHMGLKMPKPMQVDFAKVVQQLSEKSGREIEPTEICDAFTQTYMGTKDGFRYASHELCEDRLTKTQKIDLVLTDDANRSLVLKGSGNGPVSAILDAFEMSSVQTTHVSHSIGDAGPKAESAAYIQLTPKGGDKSYFGVAVDGNTTHANIFASINAVNHALRGGYPMWEEFYERAYHPSSKPSASNKSGPVPQI